MSRPATVLVLTPQETRLQLKVVANTDHSIHAALVAVECLVLLLRPPEQAASTRLPGFPQGHATNGPEVIIGHLRDVSDQPLPMLERNRPLWQVHVAPFYADSGLSTGVYLKAIAAES